MIICDGATGDYGHFETPVHYAEMVIDRRAACGHIMTPLLHHTADKNAVTCKICAKRVGTIKRKAREYSRSSAKGTAFTPELLKRLEKIKTPSTLEEKPRKIQRRTTNEDTKKRSGYWLNGEIHYT